MSATSQPLGDSGEKGAGQASSTNTIAAASAAAATAGAATTAATSTSETKPAQFIAGPDSIHTDEATSATGSAAAPNMGFFANPFASPLASRATSRPGSRPGSRPMSRAASYAGSMMPGQVPYRFFQSRRVQKGDVEKSWLKQRDPKEKWVTIMPIIGIIIGLAVSGILVWDGLRSVVKHNYCLVLDDDFSNGLDTKTWTQEVQLGGFGNGEFEQTTANGENVFVKDGHLWIMPTLQDESMIEKDSVIDLRATGTCTSTVFTDCVAATNTTAGNSSIVPPTKSGRINTKNSATIKYGRVEVTAKMPVGDWLWPAIWLLPAEDSYGPWPASGEIDIVESRGNNRSYSLGGNNIISSTLHWGPSTQEDAWWRTNTKHKALHSTYADKFNTFGLEWSQKYLFVYINSRLMQALYTNFDEPMWKRGHFPSYSAGSNFTDVNTEWAQTGRPQTPFDQPFYLILNVAVGGTNGWFQDNTDSKPWLDASKNAKKDFWNARDTWHPTWTQPQMEVSKVQMWQQCDGDEEL